MIAEQENREFLRNLGEQHRAADAVRTRRSHADRDLRNVLLGDRKSQNFFAGQWQGYSGGKFDRTNEEWNPGTVGPNRLHLQDGRILRERARDLAINNPYALSAINSYVANVVGKGIPPKPKFDNESDRKAWTAAWDVWGGNTAVSDGECDLSGIGSIYDLQELWLREIIEAGGCLLHFVELPPSRDRRIPFAIELIPEERFADERDTPLLTNYANPKTRNQIVRGVEIDPATGRPVAFWVKPSLPNDVALTVWEPIRLPAEECSYGFFRRRMGSERGFTLLYAAIVWLWRLGYYVDAELLASQMKSNWAYMVKTEQDPDFDWNSLNDAGTGATDIYGNVLEKLESGLIWRGAPGDEISAVGPNVPGSDSLPWIKLIEQSVAIGMDLSMFEMTRNAADANFSSLRAATNADRARFRKMQQFVIRKFCNPIWRRFAMSAARVGISGFPRPSEFAANIDEWLSVAWHPPGWQSVNPLDDAQADDIGLTNLTRTHAEIIGERGGDWEESFDQRERENEAIESRKLGPDPVAPAQPKQPPKPSMQSMADMAGVKR